MSFEFSEDSDVHLLIKSLKSCSTPEDVVENLKKGIDTLIYHPLKNAEDLFKYIMPLTLRTMNQVYDKNNIILQSEGNKSLGEIENNLQVALMLTSCSNEIVDYLLKQETVSVMIIPSVPISLAQILLSTFEHCKNSQKRYQSAFKSVSELIELFRKTQEVHTKFLNILDTCLVFEFLDEEESVVIKDLLYVILRISEVLSGVNIKSMADNWKAFVTLIQRYSKHILGLNCFDVSLAVRKLTNEIENNMHTLYELGTVDVKKSLQTLKMNGFLIKVVLKLFEIEVNLTENFHDVISFCVVIYSWHPGFFQTNDFPEEFVKTTNSMLYLNTQSFVYQLFHEDEFVKNFCCLNENDSVVLKHNFGLLHFSNEFIKFIPNMLIDNPVITESFNIVPVLHLIFNTTKKCYKDFFYDYNSLIYEDLVVNISAAILLFPDSYLDIEKLLLEAVLQDNIWTTLIAVDVWCTVLTHSSIATCRSTLNSLIMKIQELQFGIFTQTPVLIHLRLLTQRIFKLVPNNIVGEEISRYNPYNNTVVWKILSLRDIPLSQRFYIEFILNEIYDKVESLEKENYTVCEIISLVDCIDIISCATFNDLQINTARLVLIVNRLWSFNVCEIPSANNLCKYFIHKLLKLTVNLFRELTGEHLLLVFTQLRQLLNSNHLVKLLVCDLIQAIAKRNFNSFLNKQTLFYSIADILQLLLTDKNAVVTQVALESFNNISENDAYITVINKVTPLPVIKGLIESFMRKSASKVKYDENYFEKINDFIFHHRCLEWTDSDVPQNKKLKVDDGVDELINNLKSNTLDLTRKTSRSQLNSRQITEVKNVINVLESLLL